MCIAFDSIDTPDTRCVPFLKSQVTSRTVPFLHALPGNRFEALKGDRQGQYSIRINDQWRICFVGKSDGAHRVEIVDCH